MLKCQHSLAFYHYLAGSPLGNDQFEPHELKNIDGIFGKYKHLKSLQVRYIYTFQHFNFLAVEMSCWVELEPFYNLRPSSLLSGRDSEPGSRTQITNSH